MNDLLQKHRKLLIRLGICLSILVLLFVFRISILQGFGHFLVYEDELAKADAIYVLSGGAYDRGREAADIFNNGYAPTIICTGENIPYDILALNIELMESEITYRHIVNNMKVDPGKVSMIKEGTSTIEEAGIILENAKEQGFKTIIIVSSDFHTRRIKRVFKQKFADSGIRVIIQAATNEEYNADTWWQFEYGLINLNNEYIKLIYYWWKY